MTFVGNGDLDPARHTSAHPGDDRSAMTLRDVGHTGADRGLHWQTEPAAPGSRLRPARSASSSSAMRRRAGAPWTREAEN